MGVVNSCTPVSFHIQSYVRAGKVKRRKVSTLVHSRRRHHYKKQGNMMTVEYEEV